MAIAAAATIAAMDNATPVCGYEAAYGGASLG